MPFILSNSCLAYGECSEARWITDRAEHWVCSEQPSLTVYVKETGRHTCTCMYILLEPAHITHTEIDISLSQPNWHTQNIFNTRYILT